MRDIIYSSLTTFIRNLNLKDHLLLNISEKPHWDLSMRRRYVGILEPKNNDKRFS